jgi:hypothetical protein
VLPVVIVLPALSIQVRCRRSLKISATEATTSAAGRTVATTMRLSAGISSSGSHSSIWRPTIPGVGVGDPLRIRRPHRGAVGQHGRRRAALDPNTRLGGSARRSERPPVGGEAERALELPPIL